MQKARWTKIILAGLMLSWGLALTAMAAEENSSDNTGKSGESFDEMVQRIKNPTPWFKWGFDQRLREIWADNLFHLNESMPGHEWHFQRYRSRLWGTFTPVENLEINTRLAWEWREWCKPQDGPYAHPSSVDADEALFDKMNVKWSNAFDMPLDIKVGRQDIILGNGWLVLDGTPNDGSRTIFFDAARLTYKMEDAKTNVDLIYIDQWAGADKTIEPFCDSENDFGLTDQGERGIILYASNKSLVPKSQLDGYFIWKHDREVNNRPISNDGHTYALGARLAGDLDDHWKYRGEFAQETGKKNYEDLCAFGFNSRLSYHVNDKWNNRLHCGYEYLSGDDPGTDTIEAFDPLWARWPQWSEMYIYTYAMETRVAETTNLHRVFAGWQFNPTKKTELSTYYNLLFADENTRKDNPTFINYSDSGSFRGQLLTVLLNYKYTKYISGHILGEFLFPGNYYSQQNRDITIWLRYELMLTF